MYPYLAPLSWSLGMPESLRSRLSHMIWYYEIFSRHTLVYSYVSCSGFSDPFPGFRLLPRHGYMQPEPSQGLFRSRPGMTALFFWNSELNTGHFPSKIYLDKRRGFEKCVLPGRAQVDREGFHHGKQNMVSVHCTTTT